MRVTRRATLAFLSVGLAILLASGVALAANLEGTSGADTITGTSSIDYINGNDGNDTINGLAGGDQIQGGNGNDQVGGGDGPDTINGNNGDDRILDGGNGADNIEGGSGKDELSQGPRTDTARDTLKGGTEDDVIDAANYPTAYADTVECGTSYDRVYADSLDSVASDCESVMRISSRTSTQVSGSVKTGTSPQVNFNSRLVSGGGTLTGGKPYDKETTSTMTVSGISLSVTVNPATKTITRKGSGTPSAQDKQAMREALADLGGFLNADNTNLINQEALAIRQLTYVSQAPVGYRFADGTSRYSATTTLAAPSPNAGSNAVQVSAEGALGAAGVEGCEKNVIDTPVSGDDRNKIELTAPPVPTQSAFTPLFLGDDGIAYLSCSQTYNDADYDLADGTVYDTYTYYSGDASGTDVGRCGPQDPSVLSFLQGGYTTDCLEHDVCVAYEGGSTLADNADCGNEFFEATEDFFLSIEVCDVGFSQASRRPPEAKESEDIEPRSPGSPANSDKDNFVKA